MTMLEILQFYVSGFWTWAGLTFGLAMLGAILDGLLRRRNKG